MANLIIKPTSGGSLILQDEGGTAANTISATGNTTLAGTANVLGTGSGTLTLNTGSVLNHNALYDSWFGYLDGAAAFNSAVIDFNTQRHVGGGITESAGRYTVSKAGLYQINCSLKINGTSTTTTSCFLRIDGTSLDYSRMYQNQPTPADYQYGGVSGQWVVGLNANQIVDIYGTGNFHDDMCVFSGVRIGGKS